MKKQKAILVTIAMTLMLVVILAFMLITGARIFFFVIGGIFAVVGIVCADAWLLDWLTETEEPEELEPVLCNQENIVPPEVASTVEEIMDEVRQG
jgi:hypothetical protein